LENVRFLAEETFKAEPAAHAQSNLVKRLAPLVDVFVSDGFAVSHRSHASVVGFAHVLPTVAGRLMEKEVVSVEKFLASSKKPHVLVLGGVKVEDSIRVMENMLSQGKVDKILTAGLVGELFLLAKGVEIGEPNMDMLRKTGGYDYVGRAKLLLKRHSDKIEYPVDVAVTHRGKRKVIPVGEPINDMIKDIGDETLKKYVKTIKQAKTIFMNGPVGVFENPVFAKGTRSVFQAIKDCGCFSLLGGGHTSSAVEELGFKLNDFSYVSLAGGAMITWLSGEELPGVEAIKP
jgi:phosphoglycerate kinase